MLTIEKLSELITDKVEKCLLFFEISPLYKKDRNYCVIELGNRRYVLCGVYSAKEYIEFIHEAIPCDMSYREFTEKLECTKEFVQLFRKRFFKKIELDCEETNALIDEILSLDYSENADDCCGLDGFTLSAFLPETKQSFSFWCNYYNELNLPLATLANKLLEDDGIVYPNNFHQKERPY